MKEWDSDPLKWVEWMRLKTERWVVSEDGCTSLTTRAHDFFLLHNQLPSLSLSLSLLIVCVCVHACWELIISGKISQSSWGNRAWKWKWKQVSNCKPIFLSTHSPFPVLSRLWRWISENWWFGPGGSDPFPGGATLLLQPWRRSRVVARSYTDLSLTPSLSLSL